MMHSAPQPVPVLDLRTSPWLARIAKTCLLAALPVLLSLGTTSSATAQGKKPEPGLTLVKVERIALKPQPTAQSFVGSLEPIRRAVIGSAVEERVAEVLVREGDFVQAASAGQPATVLVQLERQAIDLDLEAAQIELTLRNSAAEELAGIIPSEIDAAAANVARLESELAYAEQVYERMRGLGSSMSEKEVEESTSLFNSASQSLNVAKAELQRLRATRDIRLTIGQRNIARQQAEINRLTEQQSRHSVTAPFDGYVTRKLVEKGTWVTQGTPLIEIVQLDPIELRVQIPQEYSRVLQESFDTAGEQSPLLATVTIDSMEQPLTGQVVRIIPDADPLTRAIPVLIRLANPASAAEGINSHLLKPGLLAVANLNIGLGKPVLMVPKDCARLE